MQDVESAGWKISMCWDNDFQSHSLRKLVVAFVNSYSVGGQFPTNPFNFQGYDLKHITVFVDGHPVGGNPIKMNFDDSGGQSVTETLLSLYQVSNRWMNDAGVTYSFFPHTHFSPRKNEYILSFLPGKMSIY